jgi:signal transduction histidine kinase
MDPKLYFEQFAQYFSVVNEEIDRLNQIVVDFLFAVRPMDIEFRAGSINAIIQELIEFTRYELEENNIQWVLNLNDAIPPMDLDERFMKQALPNLVKNAIAAMPDGGTLTISSDFKHDDITVEIQDTGTGIPEDILPKIFEPYFTTKPTGSGLGLTLVFKIIREHHGEITVKSKEGKGTTIVLTFPVPQGEAKLIPFNDWESGVSE